MSARLERYIYAPMVALALWAVLQAASPDVAKAQGLGPPKDAQGTEHVVVVPGDSLWSISREQFRPNATPQQIATAVERIHALNRNQIGGDPNLIFPGQKLSLPPMGEPSTAEASTGTTPAREAIEPAKANPLERAVESKTNRAPSTSVGKTAFRSEKAPDPVAEPARLPDAAAPAPAVRLPVIKDWRRSPLESFAIAARSGVSAAESAIVGTFPDDNESRRKLRGLGIIALTLLIAALMVAWKLPMRRDTGKWEAWGILEGTPRHHTYLQSYAPPELTRESASTATRPSPDPAPPAGDAIVTVAGNGNDLRRVKLAGIASVKRRRRRYGRIPRPGGGRPPRKGLATRAHNPKVRRSLLRAAVKNRSEGSENGFDNRTRGQGVSSTRTISEKLEAFEHGHKPLGPVVGEESRPEPKIHLLSTRQREILGLVAAEELPNAQIAKRLFITESTVKQHLYRAYKILGVRNRREAAKFLGRHDQAEQQPVTAVGAQP